MPSIPLFDPTLPVKANAVKNVLFRAATLLLQFTVFRIFSYLAYQSNAYTSFLMLTEDLFQKFFYISSRGLGRNSLIVLGCAILFPAASLYDTLLWALDSPGYMARTTLVNAATLSDKLLGNPGYIITVSNLPDNANSIDIAQTMSANLFQPGLNLSLPGAYSQGEKEAYPSPQPLSQNVGPRIWLDKDTWSVDSNIVWPVLSNPQACAPTNIDSNHQRWRCNVNNSDAFALFQRTAGDPRVWWESVQDTPEDMTPDRKANAWDSLGRYGDTALMKQVFTVTKGTRRHTLLETVMKVSMLTYFPTPFQTREVVDLIRRIWDDDPTLPVPPDPDSVAQVISASQQSNGSFTLGYLTKQDYAVHALSIEMLNILNETNPSQQLFSIFRIITSNITLIRSDTIGSSPTPFAQCSGSFSNLAYGGDVRSTTCDESTISRNSSVTGFLGQFDTSAVLILTDVLGDGTTNTSDSALSSTGLSWYERNSAHLDNALLSRAFILGGDPSTAQMLVTNSLEPALSYLQLILICIPALFAALAWVLMAGGRKSYYKSSFLSAVCTTTHIAGNGKCKRVEYLRNPPDIELRISRAEHVVVGTPDRGTLANVGPNEVVAFAMSMEPFLRSPASMAYLEASDNNEPRAI